MFLYYDGVCRKFTIDCCGYRIHGKYSVLMGDESIHQKMSLLSFLLIHNTINMYSSKRYNSNSICYKINNH